MQSSCLLRATSRVESGEIGTERVLEGLDVAHVAGLEVRALRLQVVHLARQLLHPRRQRLHTDQRHIHKCVWAFTENNTLSTILISKLRTRNGNRNAEWLIGQVTVVKRKCNEREGEVNATCSRGEMRRLRMRGLISKPQQLNNAALTASC